MAPDWVASVPPPVLRPLAAPRVALEGVFLLAVALLAGLARLEPVWIVLVMTAAWALVAFSEWTAATKRTRWRLDEVAPSVASEGDQSAESTGPWSMPVVEATAVEQSPDSESHTVIATLPEEPEPEQPKDEQPRDEQPRDEQPAKPDGGPEPDEPAELPEADELPQPDEQDPQPARRGLRLWRRRPAATGVPDPWEQ